MIGAFLLPAVAIPALAWWTLPSEQEAKVIQLEAEAPCPTKPGILRDRLAKIQAPTHQIEIIDDAERELWDIPDPVFGTPIPWPEASTLEEHVTPQGFERTFEKWMPEGVEMQFDCTEYPCVAVLHVPEGPADGTNILGDAIDAMCEELDCSEEHSSLYPSQGWGYMWSAVMAFGDVEPDREFRRRARVDMAMETKLLFVPDWVKERRDSD